ncbi:MAG: LytTR family transcriptional regulator DNA-binding domain-containing protein [Cytophagales bacterium]|nr:LytTR family transcriptional regulator DNA-binding domain-containing protein [Cytophagales bacterium]
MKSFSQPAAVPYRDFRVRLAGSFALSHFIEVLGREESFFYLLLQKFYYVDLFSGAAIAFLVWSTIRWVTRYQDRHAPWETEPLRRSLLQGTLGIFAPALLLHLLTYLQFTYLLGQRMEDTTWLTYELPVCVLIFILLNAYYLAAYFSYRYHQLRAQTVPGEPASDLLTATVTAPVPVETVSRPPAPAEESGAEKPKRKVFILQKGARSVPVRVEDIAYIHKAQEYNFLYTFSNEKYLMDDSLDEAFAALEEKDFFRANRQTIISFRACQYYLALDYGKLEVFLQPPAEEPVVISQKRGPAFKEWMQR